MRQRSTGLRFLVCWALLAAAFVAGWPGHAAAHGMHHGAAAEAAAVTAPALPSALAMPCLQAPADHHPSDSSDAGHGGSCCVAGCSASGILAQGPDAAPPLRSERCAPEAAISMRAHGVAPPDRPPRQLS